MEDNTLSWSIERVEYLISSLYEPGQPNVITEAQALLANFQSSPQAWILAHELLGRSNEKGKFFGALTVIVKLNRESSSLSEDNARELLEHLIGWYRDSFEDDSGSLVPRKLSSALATFFLHFHQLWPGFVRHITMCLISRQYHDPRSVQTSADIDSLLDMLDPKRLKAVLWVVTSIMDDVVRVDWNTADRGNLYDSVVGEVTDAAALLSKGLAKTQAASVSNESVKCLQSWIFFAQKVSSRDSHVQATLKDLMPRVIETLPSDSHFGASAELLIDVLSTYPALLSNLHFDLLTDLFLSTWADECYNRLLQGNMDFESLQFGQLLLAFGEEKCQWLMRSEDYRSKFLLSRLCGLLGSDGYPVVENRIFVPAIEFWSTYTEVMSDFIHLDNIASQAWAESALSQILEVVSAAFRKITYPPAEVFSQWDSSDRVGFSDARKDVVDLLQSAYSLSGLQLINTFTNLILVALNDSAWLQLETAAFCLVGLADCSKDDVRLDQALKPVFESSLFSNLSSPDTDIPVRTRQTCLHLIDQYTEYFERNVAPLAPALRLLFDLLRDPSMAPPASKTILRLCSSCRHHLHTEADGFLNEYQTLTERQGLDCVSSERVLAAIASITQAVPDTSRRYNACTRLLEFLQADSTHANELAQAPLGGKLLCSSRRCIENSPDDSPGLHVALKALRCLVGIGKGFQSPAESTVDLDARRYPETEYEDRLGRLHRQVMQILLDIEGNFGKNGEVSELVCAVLRCGFSESEPGPFVLDFQDVTSYLTSHCGNVTRPGLYVSTACSFISSLYVQTNPKKGTVYSTLLLWVIQLLQQSPGPEHDPELSQNSIDFACRLLTKSPVTLLTLHPSTAAESFFLFTIQILDGSEPLPKAAAAEFWATFIALNSDLQEVSDAAKQVMGTLGPLLAQSLARNIGGRASRSELDKLSEPIKRLVGSYPLAKEWLQDGLSHTTFPSDKITLEQKALFVKKFERFKGYESSGAGLLVVRSR
ncbi:importin 13 [Metarhizium rileyi]|uniref:Importin 13 n=1 Tax=Metarhizium rileyi (strain RCEF 4871) TaxID=1649241 RepID=A0A167F7Z2_METRR|nr:importin 13 [Metarhizium rileyi RCEF 4871]